MPSRDRWGIWVMAAIPLLGFWAYGLFDLDEGFYAAVTGEMLRRGDWITPHFNGAPWFEKPILLYWISAPWIALFGPDLGPRFSSFLCGLGLIGAVWAFGRRYMGEGAGWRAALVLATSLLAIALGRLIMTDAALILTLTLALLTFWRSLTGDPRWRVASAAFLGISVLAKGPVGCAIFVIVVAWTFWREPDLRPRFRGYWLAGTLVFLAIVAAWYLPAYLAHPKLFVDEFLIKQNIERFAGGDAAHRVDGVLRWVFYVPVLLLGMAPWSFLLWRAWPRRATGDPFARYLATWAAVIFLFFTVSETKLVHYIAPCLPPLAMLVGGWLAARPAASTRPARRDWLTYGGLTVAMGVVANAGFLYWYRASGHAELHALTRWLKAQPGQVIEFQMSRREADRGTGGMRMMDTSHPSIVFYLDRVVPKPETLDELLAQPRPGWVLTRNARILPEDVYQARGQGIDLIPTPTPTTQSRYRVWRIE